MFCAKVHKRNGIKILAICDKELLEKEFMFKDIKIKISRNFYFDMLLSEKDLKRILETEHFDVINVFGNNITDLLLKFGLVEEKNVLKISEQKHAIIQTL